MNIVLVGPPGVGKGTVAAILSGKLAIPHISTGNMLREVIAKGTALGIQAKDYVDAGRLVPDELVTSMVRERVAQPDCKGGFILDGYPRTTSQAKALQDFSAIDAVLDFKAPFKTIVERIAGRRTCRKCSATYHTKYSPPKKEGICDKCGGELYQRSDEKPGIITERLKVYEEQNKPLIDYYRNEQLLSEIDASYHITEISKIVSQCEEALRQVR
ncbi:MAG TPA: adenylate kinase [Candidatus Nanoarchaeia archaeon]|nr:adenylate kinase [Candidatus Nanoarchaeia archaeon]